MLKRARAFLERNKKTVAVAGMAVALAGATLRYLHTPKEHHEQKPPAQTGTRAAATMEEAARHQRIEREKLETGRMSDIEKAYSPLLKNSTPDIRRILVKTMGICAEVKNSTNYSILDFHRALISLSAKLTGREFRSVQDVWIQGNQRSVRQFEREVGARLNNEFDRKAIWRTGIELNQGERVIFRNYLVQMREKYGPDPSVEGDRTWLQVP